MQLRSSYLGAICIALLFSWAVARVVYQVTFFISEECIRSIDYFIRTSFWIHPLLRECEFSWSISAGELWLGLLGGLAAVMIARWLYAPEKQH
jgi:hypothetical protein